MLSKPMQEALNNQVKLEAASSYAYLVGPQKVIFNFWG
jgi:ferritin